MRRTTFHPALPPERPSPAGAPLRAQTWPDKPVAGAVAAAGLGAGQRGAGAPDRLSKAWGQPLVIDNKPGGQNTIGAQAAARSPADGSNFYFATTAALVTNPLLFKSPALRPAEGLRAGRLHRAQPVRRCWSNAKSPLRRSTDLIDRAKAAAGLADARQRGAADLQRHDLARVHARAKVEPNQVPYAPSVWACRTCSAATSTRWSPISRRPPLSSRRASCACWPSPRPSAWPASTGAGACRVAARLRDGRLVRHRRADRHAARGAAPEPRRQRAARRAPRPTASRPSGRSPTPAWGRTSGRFPARRAPAGSRDQGDRLAAGVNPAGGAIRRCRQRDGVVVPPREPCAPVVSRYARVMTSEQTHDVAIVGLGAMGSAAAFELSRRGAV